MDAVILLAVIAAQALLIAWLVYQNRTASEKTTTELHGLVVNLTHAVMARNLGEKVRADTTAPSNGPPNYTPPPMDRETMETWTQQIADSEDYQRIARQVLEATE